MLKQLIAITIVIIFPFTASVAKTCRTESLSESTPTSQFLTENETVTDKATTLSWMRCAVGQKWDGNSCQGKAQTLGWQDAMVLVDKINDQGISGHHDWRMPMVPELASIVERQCFNPRMNTAVFPGAPSVVFWSSMEKMGMKNYAYTLNFGSGEAVATTKDHQGAVRLVRGGPWWKPPMMSQKK